MFETHKDKRIDIKDLHWGEEIEYSLYSFKPAERSVKLSCDANDIIQAANFGVDVDNECYNSDFKLLPEFGDWMLEAVPEEPYNSYADPKELLSCFCKISLR